MGAVQARGAQPMSVPGIDPGQDPAVLGQVAGTGQPS